MNSKQHALELMQFAHAALTKALTMPDERAFSQPFPESNHSAWTMGHLACTYAWLATMLDAKADANIPDSYNGLFGMESKPSGDAKKYPPLGEIRKKFEGAYTMLVGLVEKLPEKDVWDPTASDGSGFTNSKLDAAYKCAWHDGWHAGQVADNRRAMKIGK